MLKKKKAVSVMNAKKFFVAYSEYPFLEEKNGYPDYEFQTVANLHYCVRVGDLNVPWGFGSYDGIGYAANGEIHFARKNVGVQTFHGKNLPYEKVGDVFYLPECEFYGEKYHGYTIYLRDHIIPIIKKIAKERDADGFERELSEEFSRLEEVQQLMREHALMFKGVTIRKIVKEDEE